MNAVCPILHSDLNSFYASVETMLDPTLRGKAVAVCGSTEDRHGIVLAKSELAKKTGIKTGMVTWEAKRLCPDLIVKRPQYDQYLKYSNLTKSIYKRYTDKVEPFGMDECWVDLRGSYGRENGPEVADELRWVIHEELGMTVSIGVSFTKIFAKLGSDMKKPDAVTVISEENYKEKVWPLPASELLYVGRATTKKLAVYGIHTIGDIAAASPDFLKQLLGVNGIALWRFASGLDNSRVMQQDFEVPIKTIGHGITCNADLLNSEEVWKVMLELSQDIGQRLRTHEFIARGVQITVKDNTLAWRQFQTLFEVPTQSPIEIARRAHSLFEARYDWRLPVRSVTVRAINLISASTPVQLSLFDDLERREKRERLEDAIEDIRSRFGNKAIFNACLLGDLKMGHGTIDVTMPGVMYQ